MGLGLDSEVEKELEELRDDPQPVMLEMDKVTAWCLLSNLQLALRHPGNKGPSSQIARNVAMNIQAAICPEPESALARVAEQGWDERRIIIPQ
jgi:hypothetical protein